LCSAARSPRRDAGSRAALTGWRAGSFAFTSNQDLFLMGFTSGLSWFVPSSGEVEKICDYEADLNTRPNDGKCDREGNFVIGG